MIELLLICRSTFNFNVKMNEGVYTPTSSKLLPTSVPCVHLPFYKYNDLKDEPREIKFKWILTTVSPSGIILNNGAINYSLAGRGAIHGTHIC